MDAPVLQEKTTQDDLQEENLRLKAELKRQEELYENSNLELIKWMVESEKQSKEMKRLNHLLQKTFFNTIEIIQNTIEIKDPGSKDHAERVAGAAKFIAKMAGSKGLSVEKVAVAAKIHEIGKIAIPENILSKDRGSLPESEKRLLERHPVLGAACLEEVEGFRSIAKIIKHQKEKYNGEGKPESLSGEEIPLGSRIIAIADSFDTVYLLARKFDSPAEALNAIQQRLDLDFDRALFPHLYAYVMQHYSQEERSDDRKIAIHELQAGMRISRDLLTAANVLLVPKDTLLDQTIVQKIIKHQTIDPVHSGIYVYIS